MSQGSAAGAEMIVPHDQFAHAIAAAGPAARRSLPTAAHRFASNGNPNDDAGFYVFHDAEIPFGSPDVTEVASNGAGASTWAATHRRRTADAPSGPD
jgi:hypothetical protein